MLAILQFMFSSFWVWLGGLFYLALIAGIIGGLIRFNFNVRK